MPPLFLYLLKVCCGLSLVYLFYRITLRELTFYTANRWYLLLLSGFCFVLPLLDVNPFIEPQRLNRIMVVRAIPVVNDYVNLPHGNAPQPTIFSSFGMWEVVKVIWLTGSLLLLVRLFITYLSYRKIKKEAQVLLYNGIRLFQVNRPILPFSFGNAIFLGQQRHSAEELQNIIGHELVHVEQHHTIDVIWAELLCALTWYNPFSWLLRYAIRQNLEFIADSKVVQSGLDKKAYQYLLLSIIGRVGYPTANQFNFSSLKKRIIMLNKLPSTKAHLIKFFLVFPLTGVLLLACRNNKSSMSEEATAQKTITLSGIIVETGTHKGLGNVLIKEAVTGLEARTDSRGFYVLDIPVKNYPFEPKFTYSKEGYGPLNEYRSFTGEKSKYRHVSIMNMEPIGADGKIHGSATLSCTPIDNKDVNIRPTYEEAARYLSSSIRKWEEEAKFQALREQSSDPYIVMDGHSYVTSNGGWASVDEITDIVFVDGIRMTGAEVNRRVSKSKIKSLGAMDRAIAKEKLGIDKAVLQIFINTSSEGEMQPNAF